MRRLLPQIKNAMAYKVKTKSGYTVKKGNSGDTLKTFRGKAAKKKACNYVDRLHKKNNPKQKNRGKTAQRREERR